MSDDNFGIDSHMDYSPPQAEAHPVSGAALCAFLRTVAPQGMRDIYRTTDPDGRATTYQRPRRGHDNVTAARYDVLNISTDGVGTAGKPVRTWRLRTRDMWALRRIRIMPANLSRWPK